MIFISSPPSSETTVNEDSVLREIVSVQNKMDKINHCEYYTCIQNSLELNIRYMKGFNAELRVGMMPEDEVCTIY